MLGKKTKNEHSSFEKQIQIMNEDNSIIEYNGKVDSSNQLIDLLKKIHMQNILLHIILYSNNLLLL